MAVLLVGVNTVTARADSVSLLRHGDEGLLAAPVANFRTELKRIKLAPPEFHAVSTHGFECENSEATNIAVEAENLRAALSKAGLPAEQIEHVATNHVAARGRLEDFSEAMDRWKSTLPPAGRENPLHFNPLDTRPDLPELNPPADLPGEFADCLAGVRAEKDPDHTPGAGRAALERLLARPPDQRHFKSTWAAYRLGRSWEDDDPARAIEYYRQTRELARTGFSDSLGLAAASYGREARVCLNQTNYERAIELYLQQWATGDESAYMSLCYTMRAMTSGDTSSFPSLAKNSKARRVVTAYIIATDALRISAAYRYDHNPETSNHLFRVVGDWLAAMNEADEHNAELAEQLALAAYQNGQWDAARNWIARAGSSPTTQWLQAKLLLRARKIRQAESLLESIAARFPLEPAPGLATTTVALKDDLTVSAADDGEEISAGRHIRAELGVIHLANDEFTQALHDFLRAGIWYDAAYVADRIMTVDELKAYVDLNAPATDSGPTLSELNASAKDEESSEWLNVHLRHLLARRLTRVIRGNEAREYYPEDWKPQFDAFAGALTTGWNESLPAEPRAEALFTAANLAYENGMELFGTELAPDWSLCDGNCEGTLTATLRTGEPFTLLPASSAELQRYDAHRPDPDVRFHYRYQAAFLGWEAAKLLPDNSDQTAWVLCTSGSWLKARDPQTADLFYKSLVRRCRKTELGDEADRRRWFPEPDEPETSAAPEEQPEEMSTPDEPAPTTEVSHPVAEPALNAMVYIVESGDTLAAIAQRAGVTIREIREANSMTQDRIVVGQRLLIPEHEEESPPQ